jgi:uncharacterized repeat protein (TIGR01451 family)
LRSTPSSRRSARVLVLLIAVVIGCAATGGAAAARNIIVTAGVDPTTGPVASTGGDFTLEVSGTTPVLSGQPATFTITITNTTSGNTPLGGFTVSNAFTPSPSGTTVYSTVSGNGVTCTTADDVGMSCEDLPANGDSETFTATFTAPVVNSTNPSAHDVASASTDTDSGTADLGVSLDPAADLSVTDNVSDQGTFTSSGKVVAGNHVRYTILLTNNGPSTAQGVSLHEMLDVGRLSNLKMCSVSGTDPCVPSGSFSTPLTVGSLASDDSKTWVIDGVLNPSALPSDPHLTDSVTATSTTADPAPGDETATTDAPIDTRADLALTNTVADQGPVLVSGKVVAGNHVRYTIQVTNNGPSDARSVSISDTIDAGVLSPTVKMCSFTGPGSCTPSTTFSTPFSMGTVGAGNSKTWVIDAVLKSNTLPSHGPLTNSAAVTSTTVDPSSGQEAASADATIDTRADLATADVVVDQGPVLVAGKVVAGNHLRYTIHVTNNGPSDAQNVSIDDTLDSGVLSTPTMCSVAGLGSCTPSTAFSTPLAVGTVASGDSETWVIDVVLKSSALPSHGQLTNAVSASSDTVDQTPGNNSATADATIDTRADLQVVSMTSSTNLLFAAPANTVTFTLTLTNAGPSDAQAVNFTSPGLASPSTLPAFILDSGITIGEVDAGATPTVTITAHVNTGLGHAPPSPIVSGPLLARSSVLLNSTTQDQTPANNIDATALTPGVTIHTAPSPPRSAFAIPGTGNAILTWETPSSTGGQTITGYTITVTPPTGAPAVVGSPFTVPVGAHTSFCGNVGANDCYQLIVSGLKNDSGAYQFDVVAQNAVGGSDPGTALATPSVDAQNAAVAAGTAKTLTTCTTATTAHPVCVQYIIPSGVGGVFGAQGNVGLTSNLCGGITACFGSGSQALASLAGYNDRTHPLLEIITFDAGQIPPIYKSAPICANNSTKTNCYPNNVQFYAEMSFALALMPDPGGELLTAHFCSASVAQGGAGNQNYARPDPHTGPYLGFNDTPGHGYTDTAGSACLKKANVLGSKPDASANGDVQIQVNLTSDSDQLIGKH